MDYTLKFALFERLQEQLDDRVWEVFDRYLKVKGGNFSYPDAWNIEGNDIKFTGQDGCMGCYDREVLRIPMKFFLDPDEAVAELGAELEEKARVEREEKVKRITAQELKELDRLNAKYGTRGIRG